MMYRISFHQHWHRTSDTVTNNGIGSSLSQNLTLQLMRMIFIGFQFMSMGGRGKHIPIMQTKLKSQIICATELISFLSPKTRLEWSNSDE